VSGGVRGGVCRPGVPLSHRGLLSLLAGAKGPNCGADQKVPPTGAGGGRGRRWQRCFHDPGG